jgi:hypothetical protein
MNRRRKLCVGATFLIVIGVLVAAQLALQGAASAQAKQAAVQAPTFQVDPMWPKPLPNNWVFGNIIGISVDSRDHVWITHRGSTTQPKEAGQSQDPPLSSLCCTIAPPIVEFDPAGNVVSSWGGPGAGYEWPDSMHGLTVDFKDNVWLGANGKSDNQVLKFSRQGKFLLQIGRKGASKGNTDTANVRQAAEVSVDPTTNEAYVADGYGNRRVIVFDADTGAYKRHWGAYGKMPDDAANEKYDPKGPPSQMFRTVHCTAIANDGLVYVCDRANNRIQVFKKDGTYVKEAWVQRDSIGDGAIFDMDFSKDAQQRYLFVADGNNHRVWTLLRDPLQIVSHFGNGGRMPGEFYAIHNLALDSKGNVYTCETYEGKRVQKFVYKGLGAAAQTN